MRVRQPTNELRLDRDPRLPPYILSRTGVSFTTVCLDCHRSISDDDNHLKTFVERARRSVKVRPKSVDVISVAAPSDAIIRCILAHNLTSRFSSDGNAFETAIRAVVRDKDLAAAEDLYLYIWPYAGDVVLLMHDFTALHSGGFSPLGSTLSFPPLTFFVVNEPMPGFRGMRVTQHLRSPETRIPIDLRIDPTGTWPFSAGARMGGARFAEFVLAEEDV